MTFFASPDPRAETASPHRHRARIVAIVAGGVVILAVAFGGGIAVGAALPDQVGPGQTQDGRFPGGVMPGGGTPDQTPPDDEPGQSDDSGSTT